MSYVVQACECVLLLSASFTVFVGGLWLFAKTLKE